MSVGETAASAAGSGRPAGPADPRPKQPTAATAAGPERGTDELLRRPGAEAEEGRTASTVGHSGGWPADGTVTVPKKSKTNG